MASYKFFSLATLLLVLCVTSSISHRRRDDDDDDRRPRLRKVIQKLEDSPAHERGTEDKQGKPFTSDVEATEEIYEGVIAAPSFVAAREEVVLEERPNLVYTGTFEPAQAINVVELSKSAGEVKVVNPAVEIQSMYESKYCNYSRMTDHLQPPRTCLDRLCFRDTQNGVYKISPEQPKGVAEDPMNFFAKIISLFATQGMDGIGLALRYFRGDPLPYELPVYCDQKSSKGGWTAVLRRIDGDEMFDKRWETFKLGWGEPDSEFYIGNDNLHYLTSLTEKNELRIEIKTSDGVETFAEYGNFKVASEEDGYMLTVEDFNADSTAADLMTGLSGTKFVTGDRVESDTCETTHLEGFWMPDDDVCGVSNINTEFSKGLEVPEEKSEEEGERPPRKLGHVIQKVVHGRKIGDKTGKKQSEDEENAESMKAPMITVEMMIRPVYPDEDVPDIEELEEGVKVIVGEESVTESRSELRDIFETIVGVIEYNLRDDETDPDVTMEENEEATAVSGREPAPGPGLDSIP